MELSEVMKEAESDKIFAAHAQNGEQRVMGSRVLDGKRYLFERMYKKTETGHNLEDEHLRYHMDSLTLWLLTCIYAHGFWGKTIKNHGDDDIIFFRNLSQMVREGGTDFRYK